MIDAHCHLQLLSQRVALPLIKERAIAAGVSKVVSCACSFSDWASQPIDDSFILPQFGIHPWWASDPRPEDWIDTLRAHLTANPKAGVGEIGLDKNKAKRSEVLFPVQVEVFLAQLRVAKEMRRVVSVHCVNAYGPLVDILKNESPLAAPVVIHSFSGSAEVLSELVNLYSKGVDVYFSVSAQCPRDIVVGKIPIDRLLIETDSPDQPFSSGSMVELEEGMVVPPMIDEKTNDPSQLPLVAKRVGMLSGRTWKDVAESSRENAERVLS